MTHARATGAPIAAGITVLIALLLASTPDAFAFLQIVGSPPQGPSQTAPGRPQPGFPQQPPRAPIVRPGAPSQPGGPAQPPLPLQRTQVQPPGRPGLGGESSQAQALAWDVGLLVALVLLVIMFVVMRRRRSRRLPPADARRLQRTSRRHA